MRALVKWEKGPGHVALGDMPEPPCTGNQVKIEVAYCGVCGTDLHVLHDTFRNFPPVILGHEFSGEVVETGKDVTRVKRGDKVTVLPASAVICGKCAYCRAGYFMFCPDRRGMGHGVNGAFAKYAVVRDDQCYAVPEGFGLDEAALSEPFAAAVQATIDLTELKLGDVVLVSGPGPIGLMCLKLLLANGLKTIVAGAPNDHDRLAKAKAMGAEVVVNVGERDLVEAVKEETGGRLADVVLECAGHPSSVRNCLDAVRPLGRYTQVGICGQDISVPFDRIFFKQLTVVGSVAYTARTWDRMMAMFAQGKVRLNDLISDRMGVSDWEKAFGLCTDKKALKVLMSPEESSIR
jgi:L-iditol 2-dehydrogenase